MSTRKRSKNVIGEIEKALVEMLAASAGGRGPFTKRRGMPRAATNRTSMSGPSCTALGRDLRQIHGLGAYLVLRLVGECGDDMTRWRTSKHFTSWLCLAPGNKISGGRCARLQKRRHEFVQSGGGSATYRGGECRADADSTRRVLRRLAAHAGKAKAVTATARKLAVLFYKALRFGDGVHRPRRPTVRGATIEAAW